MQLGMIPSQIFMGADGKLYTIQLTPIELSAAAPLGINALTPS